MQKHSLNKIFSGLLIITILFVVGINRFSEKQTLTQKTEQKSKKQGTEFTKINALSEATVQMLNFELGVALNFAFEVIFDTQKYSLSAEEYPSIIQGSYWSKLFVSNIIINAP